MERIDLSMSAALRSTTRPTSPTYAIWKLWDSLLKSGKLRQLTHVEYIVFQALVHHCSAETWLTWVSIETLTRDLPCSRSSVQRAMMGLQAKGFIGVIHRPGQSSLVQLAPAILDEEVPHHEAPTRPTVRPPKRRGGPMVGHEQSKQIQNRAEQQTELPPAVVAPSIDLPEDLALFAESDRTIGRAIIAKLIERHGEEKVRQAVEFIRSQYDGRGIRVLNRGGLLRTAVDQGFQAPGQIKEQEKAEKEAIIEQQRPMPDATWGRSPSGQVLTVVEVRPDAVKLRDLKDRESMLPNWATAGWVWGKG